jgi:hypothetical protein
MEVGKMTRFYDARNDAELETIEEILETGGVEFSVNGGSDVKEIMVAEEDVPFAEELLFLSTRRVFCNLSHI